MSRKLPDGPGYTIAQGLTHECLLEDAGTTDTHPSLNERLRALEVEPSTDYLPIKPAANVFLGQLKSPLVEEFDRWWQESLAETWKNSFESRNSREEALKELEEKARGDNPFTSNDRWNYASLVEEFHGGEAALPHFEAIMDVNPLDAEAELCIGRILLVEQPAEGIQRLEKIIDEHVERAPEAATLLYTHFAKLGEKEAAERFRKQSLSSLDNHEEALAAESDPFDPQQYIEHGLLPDKISQLGSLFSRSEAIKAVYLVRKKKRQFGRPSVFVVGLSFHRFKGRESKVDEAVGLLLLEFELPGPFEVAPMIKDLTNLQKTFQQIPDSLIFQSR